MKAYPLLFLLLLIPPAIWAAEWKENQFGVVGYDDTEMLPWVEFRKHDSFRPKPEHVRSEPILAVAPEDAVVLFNGFNMDAWQPNEWEVKNGILTAGEGDILTREAFGDCQLHLEFRVPRKPTMDLGDRGNSGVFLMRYYEIQIFDSHPMHATQIYPDGQCAAIYGETPPLKNVSRKPGLWQSFDLVFRAPRFDDGRLVEPARVTLLHNGVLVHRDEPVRGPTGHREVLPYRPHPDALPLKIQGHGSAVQFRNIWIRKL